MHDRRGSWLVGGIVLALIASNCGYELPAIDTSVNGQGGSGGDTGASGGLGSPEVCFDGLDNDGDDAVDCADADCTNGFTCSDIPLGGWTLVTVERGDGVPPAAVPCASGDMPATFFVNPAGPAECTPCMCEPLMGTTCSPPPVSCYLNSITCGGAANDWTNDFANGSCMKPDLGGAVLVSCQLTGTAQVDQPGECQPSATDFANKDSWTGWVRACPISSTGAGCTSGACIPKSVSSQSTCIQKAGQEACPAGWTLLQAYASANDDRACTACLCAPSAECMGGSYVYHDYDNCAPGGDGNLYLTDGTCQDASVANDQGTHSIEFIPPTAMGSCIPQGGEATGSVMPQEPVTFCCQ